MNLDRDPETNQAIQTFAIVSCGSKKADEKTAAKDLYTSTHFQLKRRWAELYCDGWLILSAEHRLIRPKKQIEPYDTSVRDLEDDDLQEWVDGIRETLWFRTNSYAGRPSGNKMAWDDLPDDFEPNLEVVLLAGAAYLDPLEEFLEDEFPASTYRPLSGLRIGEQNRWLKTWSEAHPSLEDVTEETAVAIDYNVDDTGDADVYYVRHGSGNVMVVPSRDSGEPQVLNDTLEEGSLNSPSTAMRDHRCWTVSASEVPDVDGVEWEVKPTLTDFAEGSA